MIKKVLPLLNRLIPSSLARKGLAKNIPQLDNYFESAVAAGYGIDSALDFLRNQIEGTEEQGLRPDEQAAVSRVKQQGAGGKAIQQLGNLAGMGLGAAAVPEVIGSLFQGEREKPPRIPPPELPPEIQKDKKRIEALRKFNEQKRQREEEEESMSLESLQNQFMQGQQQQGNDELMQAIQLAIQARQRRQG